MGRGRVELKRIENKINRQVTFSKRRNGLMKKAHEISVLCDAEVAVIVFSHKGRLVEYSTDSGMEKILERYERYSYAERQLTSIHETESNFQMMQGNWTMEFARLTSRIELLHRNRSHYLGENLDTLSQKDLQNLEQQLEVSLKSIRQRKNTLMHETISELQKKEKTVRDQNSMLEKQIKEKEKCVNVEQMQWEAQAHIGSASYMIPATPIIPCLNIGGRYSTSNNDQESPDGMRRNDLDLTLEPLYSCHLGCFAG